MKKLIIPLLMLVLLSCAGRKKAVKNFQPFDKTFEMVVGDSAKFQDDFSFKLIRITSDSRCPKGANCIWAGEVTVVFKAGNEEELTMSSDPSKNPLKLGTYEITIKDVLPIKEEKEIAQKDYKLSFSIKKNKIN